MIKQTHNQINSNNKYSYENIDSKKTELFKDGKYKCPNCDSGYTVFSKLKIHIYSKHTSKKNNCISCGLVNKNKEKSPYCSRKCSNKRVFSEDTIKKKSKIRFIEEGMKKDQSVEEFIINKLKPKLGEKYIYNNLKYLYGKQIIELECKMHGKIQINYRNIKTTIGCIKCIQEKRCVSKGVKKKKKSLIVGGHENRKIYIGDEKLIKSPFDYSLLRQKCPYCKVEPLNKNLKSHIKKTHKNKPIIKFNCKVCRQETDILSSFGECCSRSCSSSQKQENKTCKNDKSRIELFNKIHNCRYKYPNLSYVDSLSIIKVECRIHGEFSIRYENHRKGMGCSLCTMEEKKDKEWVSEYQIIENFKKVHETGRYDYSRINYRRGRGKVRIGCNICGEFFNQLPYSHQMGKGCPYCAVSGFKTDKPGIVYYLRVEVGDVVTYKIGITNNSVKERFKSDYKYITVLQEHRFECGQDAYNLEQQILKEYKQYKYQGPNILISGNTELFKRDIFDLDNKLEVGKMMGLS